MLDSLLAKLAGKYFGNKIELLEDSKMDGSKKWYQSKTLWSDVATIGVAVVGFVDKYKFNGAISTSPFYSMALTFLGGFGIYSRANATDKLTK